MTMLAPQPMVSGREPSDLASRHLDAILSLSERDREVARARLRGTFRTVRAEHDVVHQGVVPQNIIILVEGWASIRRTLPDGRRQMQVILLPGDLYDLDPFSNREADHSLTALSTLTYIELRRERIRTVIQESPRIGHALWWHSLKTCAIQREWLVSLGCRTALERIAHLFCELYSRMQAIGRVDGTRCEMPLTQTAVAEATGLTPVHVNRTLQQLRAADLITFGKRELKVHDFARLKALACFSPDYIQHDHEHVPIAGNM